MIWLDPIGSIFSVTSTFLFSRAHRFAWAVALVAIMINIVLYSQKGIYGRLLLEFFYIISIASGFYLWGNKKKQTERQIQVMRPKACIVFASAAMVAIGLFSTFLSHFTDSTIPYLDAATTVGSMCAQILLCYKVIQCWIVWFVVDILVAYMQFQKGIPFHASIHLVYIFLAVYGYIQWQRILDTQSLSIPCNSSTRASI